MSTLQNETLFEEIYDMVWCDYRDNHNLTDDQLYALEQNSQYGYLLETNWHMHKKKKTLGFPTSKSLVNSNIHQTLVLSPSRIGTMVVRF